MKIGTKVRVWDTVSTSWKWGEVRGHYIADFGNPPTTFNKVCFDGPCGEWFMGFTDEELEGWKE